MNEKIIIINGETSARKALETTLNQAYTVITKSDGLEALEWLEKENQAGLIIADLNMPHLTISDFIKSVRHHTFSRHTPILVLADLQHVTERAKYLELGANDFVVKPLNIQKFRTRVASILSRTKKRQPLA